MRLNRLAEGIVRYSQCRGLDIALKKARLLRDEVPVVRIKQAFTAEYDVHGQHPMELTGSIRIAGLSPKDGLKLSISEPVRYKYATASGVVDISGRVHRFRDYRGADIVSIGMELPDCVEEVPIWTDEGRIKDQAVYSRLIDIIRRCAYSTKVSEYQFEFTDKI